MLWLAMRRPPQPAALYAEGRALAVLDGNGRDSHPSSATVEAPLVCYGENGVEKWRFRPGREVATRLARYPGAFRVETFVVFRLGGCRPAEEPARLIFPRTCVNRAMERHSTITEIVLEPGRITAAVRETTR